MPSPREAMIISSAKAACHQHASMLTTAASYLKAVIHERQEVAGRRHSTMACEPRLAGAVDAVQIAAGSKAASNEARCRAGPV